MATAYDLNANDPETIAAKKRLAPAFQPPGGGGSGTTSPSSTPGMPGYGKAPFELEYHDPATGKAPVSFDRPDPVTGKPALGPHQVPDYLIRPKTGVNADTAAADPKYHVDPSGRFVDLSGNAPADPRQVPVFQHPHAAGGIPGSTVPATGAPTAAAAPAAAAPTTLRSADGQSEGYFQGSNGVKRTVNTDGTINGKGAFTPQVTNLTGAPGATTGVNPVANLPAPTFQPPPSYGSGPRVSGDLLGAEQERKARLQDISNQLFSLGTPNTDGKRALQAQLLAQQQELTLQRYGQQGQLAQTGATLANQQDIASQGNATQMEEGAANRTSQATENAFSRAAARDASGTQVIGADGNTYTVRGNKAEAVTDTAGAPFKQPPPKDNSGALTQKDAVSAVTEMLKATDPITDPQGYADLKAKLSSMVAGTGASTPAPAVGTVKDGYKFKGGNPSDPNAWEKQ